MVTTTPVGGIGNCLFIISQLMAHAKRYNFEYCVPLTNENPHYAGQKPYIFPGVKYCDSPLGLPIYKEKNFHYEEIPFVDNVCFRGYYQSWRYFDEYRDELIKAFGFDWSLSEGLVSVHVRRSDYLKQQNFHPVITKEYIEAAMELFPGKEFCFFTDDPRWVKENFGDRDDCDIHSSNDEIADLINASCCEHNIGSNSSYSWWIHYLNRNKNKIGVFPKVWFGPNLPHDTKDLLLPHSILL